MRTRRELKESLGEQIAWLRTSAISYDAGEVSEAKRMAVIIRTLVHDTAVSRGLLSQLGMRDEMLWFSYVAPAADGFMGPPWKDGPLEPEYRHFSGAAAFECTFAQWWRGRMIEFEGSPIDRSWFVLRTANYDGGAHIDPILPAEYRAITREWGLKTHRINSAGNSYPDHRDPVPSALRTIATELYLSVQQAR